MTGQGRGESTNDAGRVMAEIRSVNHRGLKINLRASDSLSFLESQVQALIRKRVGRGSVTVQLNHVRPNSQSVPTLNRDALVSVATEVAETAEQAGLNATLDLSGLLLVPGVLQSESVATDRDETRALLSESVDAAVAAALDRFQEMRHHEAVAMGNALASDLLSIAGHLSRIQSMTHLVVERYRQKIHQRVESFLRDHGVEVPVVDLLREVQLFADRSDVSEEITRLQSHLDLFERELRGGPLPGTNTDSAEEQNAVGRKLDFIVQEMFRETNTIGSKAGDADISQHVVEIKCAIERMRELVQNLE